MTTAVVTINGTKGPLPTVLGQGSVRIPTGGKIRAGIKVLTKNAAGNPKAKEIYERGVHNEKSFDEIEKEITQTIPELKNPLTPKNVPWFTVRPQDFPNPEIAKQIMEKYSEDRGDGKKRLYRFPVIWPSDMWQSVMPHELAAWGTNEKKFWSEYSPDGLVRYCKCHAPVPKDHTGKRAVRLFGGRKITLRSENGGLCDPERCQEYQNRQCNLSGRFIFYIPGIKSINAFELHTNSFYAMNDAIQKFQTIAFMRGGRISGFLDRKQTPFYITKKMMEVSHIDAEGRPVRVKHWIIELEAPVDVSALLRANDDDAMAIAHGDNAARVLEGPDINLEETTEEAYVVESASEKINENRGPVQTDESLVDSGKKANRTAPAQAQPVPPTVRGQLTNGQAGTGPSFEQILSMAREFGIDPGQYEQYAAKRWGAGWKVNAGGRRRAFEEIESFRGEPDALLRKIDAEINVFS